jgi:hypothetical protein
MVEQRGFANVGPADDGDEAASKFRLGFSHMVSGSC